MCTPLCPCPSDVQPSQWTESRLNVYNRTNKVVNGNYTDPVSKKTYMGFYINQDNINT